MGGFFQQAMIGVGSGIQGYREAVQADQTQQANQQTIDMNKMALLATQKEAKAKEDVGQFLSSRMAADTALIQDPIKMAQLQSEASARAYRDGSFALGKELGAESAKSYAEAKNLMAVKAGEKRDSLEDFSKSAMSFEADPQNPAAAEDVVRKAIKAGIDPREIPPVTDAVKFKAFTERHKYDAMSAKETAGFIEKQHEFEQQEADRKERLKQQEAQEKERERKDAADREYKNMRLEELRESKANRKAATSAQIKTFGDKQYVHDPEHRYTTPHKSDIPGDPGYEWAELADRNLIAREQGGVTRTMQAAPEISRGIRNLKGFADTATSPFAALHGDTLLGAFERTGTQAMTPDLVVAYDAAATGLGNEYAGLMAAFGGQMMHAEGQREFQRMISREPGQSNLAAAYKLANGIELLKTYIENVPMAEHNPRIQKLLKEFDGFKPPEYYLQKMQAAEAKKLGKVQQSKDKLQTLGEKSLKEAGKEDKATSNGLPPGVQLIN